MSSIIRIKRSAVSGNPATLAAGELAYSGLVDNGSNGGDRLYIGMGTETDGNAANHIVIGGKFFTDRLDHTAGTLTANSAIVVDGNSKIDQINVDNIRIDGNTISSTNTNGDISVTPNGTGKLVLSNVYIGDSSTTLLEYIQDSSGGSLIAGEGIDIAYDDLAGSSTISAEIATDTNRGVASFSSSDFTVTDGAVTVKNVNLGSQTTGNYVATVGVTAGTGLSVSGTGEGAAVTLAGVNATDTVKGVASFNSTDFSVSAGAVSLVQERIEDIAGAMVSGTGATQNGISVGYDDVNGKLTFNVNDPVITIAGDVDGSATMTDLGNTTINVTLDTVNSNVGSFGSSTNIPVITVNGKGLVTAITTAAISSSFTIAADTGTPDVFNNGGTLTFTGEGALDTAVTNDTITFSIKDASTTVKGAASFADADFNVTSGAVELKDTVVKTITVDAGATVTPSGHGFSIIGGEGIDVTSAGTTITVAGEDASTTNKGVASFNDDDFSASAGVISIKTGGVGNAQLVNSSLTVGSTTISLGGTSTSLAGLTEITVDDININGNTISATPVNSSINLIPNGTGTVDVSGKRITSVASPTADTDAANKLYVDTVAAEGLHVQEGVDAATTGTLATISGGTVTYNNGSSGVGATLTTTGTFAVIDGVTLDVNPTMDPDAGGRVLVKNEANQAHNGIYYLTSTTVLKRDPLFDSDPEIEGGDFVFVVGGTLYGGTGWVQTATVNVIGTDNVVWQQFSGAGTYTAGTGLSLTGTEFNVNLAAAGGLEFSGANAIQLKETVAGNGITYSGGVITVNGTADRISVSADAIDIASTYAGQTSITTLGTIGTGTWQGTIVAGQYGGTGVNNNGKTITLGGNLTTSGAFSTTLTVGANTNVTLPASGTLATLAGSETISNKTITNSSIGSTNPSTAAFTTLTASGLVTFTDVTDATALGTAAVVLTGGLSVAKQIRVGTNITGAGADISTLDGFNIDGGTY